MGNKNSKNSKPWIEEWDYGFQEYSLVLCVKRRQENPRAGSSIS